MWEHIWTVRMKESLIHLILWNYSKQLERTKIPILSHKDLYCKEYPKEIIMIPTFETYDLFQVLKIVQE